MRNFWLSFAAGLKVATAIIFLILCVAAMAISAIGIIGVLSDKVPWYEPAVCAIAAALMGSVTYAILDNL